MEENVSTNIVSEISDMKKTLQKNYSPKLVKCSRCGEDIDSRGLYGHMKFTHGESGERTRIIVTEKSVSSQISEMMAELDEIHKKRATLKEKIRTSGTFSDDTAAKKLLKILDLQEVELISRVEVLEKSLAKH
jgi:hypothetical protein